MGEQPAGAFELSGSEEQQAEDGQTADPPPLPATALAASSSPPDSDFRRSTHTLEEAADEGLPTAGAHGNRGTVASSWGGGAPEGLLNAETGQPRSVQRRSDSSCIVNRSELSSGCHEDPQLLRVQEHNPQEWLGQETAAREDTAAPPVQRQGCNGQRRHTHSQCRLQKQVRQQQQKRVRQKQQTEQVAAGPAVPRGHKEEQENRLRAQAKAREDRPRLQQQQQQQHHVDEGLLHSLENAQEPDLGDPGGSPLVSAARAAPAVSGSGHSMSHSLTEPRQKTSPSGPHRLRQQALQELERHGRIPPMLQPGNERSQDEENVSSGVPLGCAVPAASPHSTLSSGSTASGRVIPRPPAGDHTSQEDPPADFQTGPALSASLPKHLRLNLALLLSRDDRLYYGETFASCISHGCGFALYGGGVSRCGRGLWGKAALRRLGCGSLAGECVLLPSPPRGPTSQGLAWGGAPLGLGGAHGSGELRVADGLQTGLVLAQGPRPLAGYCGFWRLGRRERWGVLLRGPTACKYEGQWVQDFRHGFGMQTLTQGCRYVGQFSTGQKHGKGIIVYPGGMIYAGEWEHGRICKQELLISSRHLLPAGRSRRKCHSPRPRRSPEEMVCLSSEGNTQSDQRQPQLRPRQQREGHSRSSGRLKRPTALRQAAAAIGLTSSSSSSSSSDETDLGEGSLGMEQRLTEQMEALRQFSAAPAVRHWGEEHVQCLLKSMGCRQGLCQLMREQQVDGPALLALTDADLKDMGVRAWEERRLLLLLVDLLLKLRHRHRLRGLYKAARMTRDNLLQQILIPATEIDIQGPIGEGGYSRVFKATWRYTRSLDAQHRHGQVAGSSQQQKRERRQRQLWGPSASAGQGEHHNDKTRFPITAAFWQQKEHCREPEQQDQQTSEPCGEMSVAVKTFRQRDSQGAQRSLYAELSVLSLLRHPNVLLLLGVVGPPVYGLVTEYVSGGSLFDLLHKQRVSLPLMRVVKLAREVALGMSYLHEKGVMHCDLKSPNILLTNNGEAPTSPHGLACHSTATAALGHGERVMQLSKSLISEGLLLWVPSLSIGVLVSSDLFLRGEAFTFAADVYSFGVVLWEMLVGDMPFAGIGSPSHLITVVGYGGVTPPLDKIPRPLRRFLRSCLQPDPSLRPNFAACAQLLQQLYTANLLDVEVDLNSLLGLGS
ncbi:tyrosine kinase-like [Cyclospora cayetanensis]|uniref:Tyrosine kinase-like n=1 Tax=Cyclospora cayetanensis TaxID=88456 RepID=A0A1D3D968_9EIME|nr:tyrosine kinase-like [Cyclospora cayetanensis]